VGRFNELLIGTLLPRAAELALRGVVFSASVPPGTGVAPGASISTTAAFTLHNPKGSGKNLVILSGACGYKSGTLSAGTIVWTANTVESTSPPAGTACTVVKTLISASSAGAVGLPTYTTTIVTPTILRPAFNPGAALSSLFGDAASTLKDALDLGAALLDPETQIPSIGQIQGKVDALFNIIQGVAAQFAARASAAANAGMNFEQVGKRLLRVRDSPHP
jgi:hypothetical protein